MSDPSSDSSSAAVLDAPHAGLWTAALEFLTEREGAVLSLRHGAFEGERLSLGAIARQLGINRRRAHELYEMAIAKLERNPKMRELVRQLEQRGLGAIEPTSLGDAAVPAEQVPVVPELEFDHQVEVERHGEDVEAAALQDQPMPAAASPVDEAEVVSIQPYDRDFMATLASAARQLVHAADLCRTENRFELVDALLAAHGTIESAILSNLGDDAADRDGIHREEEPMSPRTKTTKSKTKAAAKSGQPDTAENARRVAMLDRVNKGELDSSAAARELGMHPGAWALWKARQSKGQRSGPKTKAPKRAARRSAGSAKPTLGKRGRRADPTETARRVAALKRVNAGEISNAQAAKVLGLKGGTWAVWKSNFQKRTGGAKAPARRGRPPGTKRANRPAKVAARSAGIDGLSGLVARLEALQRFQQGLRERVRDLVDFVEANAAG